MRWTNVQDQDKVPVPHNVWKFTIGRFLELMSEIEPVSICVWPEHILKFSGGIQQGWYFSFIDFKEKLSMCLNNIEYLVTSKGCTLFGSQIIEATLALPSNICPLSAIPLSNNHPYHVYTNIVQLISFDSFYFGIFDSFFGEVLIAQNTDLEVD